MSRPAAPKVRAAKPPQDIPLPPLTTREVLIELAAEVFATEGYASASVRDLGRRAGVTSGAIYGNFRGKADLLAEAVDARLTTDLLTVPDAMASKSLVDITAYQFEHSEARTQLMSLLLEGALAARADADVSQRLEETVARRMEPSIKAFQSRRAEEGFDPAVNLETVVKCLWGLEIGLSVLSALGVESPDPLDRAEVVRRFMSGLQLAQAPSKVAKKVAGKTAPKPVKTVAKKAPGKRVA